MHGSVLGYFTTVFKREDIEGKRVLEVGSMDVNGSVRNIVMAHNPKQYLGVDMEEGPSVDGVCSVDNLVNEFGTNSFDVVISTEMMEHVVDWQSAFSNMMKVLRPGGLFVVTTRSIPFGYHPHPIDTWRYTPDAMGQILKAAHFQAELICPDPEHAGVFFRARKPDNWVWPGRNPHDLWAHVIGVTPTVIPKNILGLPFAPDGSGYYRMYLPFKHLTQNSGHNVLIPAPGRQLPAPKAEDLEGIDVTVMQRPAHARGLQQWKDWGGITKRVYECDDDMLNVDPSGLPHLTKSDLHDTIRECLQISELVTVSTEPLAEQFSQYNDNVVVLPNYINAELLDLERPRRDKLTLGWAGGVSHLADWAIVQDPIRDALAEHPDIDLHFVGNDFSPMLGRRARFDPWEMNVWDYYKNVDFDIGVAPLADSGFNRCKSYIRCLEYGALGIPVVASNVTPYRDYIIDGTTGYLVDNGEQWRARIRELINDADAREEMGAKAKLHAANYTIQEHWTEWRDAYIRLVAE